jgi:hypothetical protein
MIVSTKLTKHSHYPAGIPAGFFYAPSRMTRIGYHGVESIGRDWGHYLISVMFDPEDANVLQACQIFPTRYCYIFCLTNKN